MHFRKMVATDYSTVQAVAAALPQWFTAGGLASIRKDLHFQLGIVAEDAGEIVGFVTYFVNQGIATIGWMGVFPNRHRSGCGSKLLAELKKILLGHGVRSVLVSTLGDSVEYEPYSRTRSFYRKNGFLDYQKINHPENPEQEEELILRLEY